MGHTLGRTLENVLGDVLEAAVRDIRSNRVVAGHTCVVDTRIHDDEDRAAGAGASDALVAFRGACASRVDAYSGARVVS